MFLLDNHFSLIIPACTSCEWLPFLLRVHKVLLSSESGSCSIIPMLFLLINVHVICSPLFSATAKPVKFYSMPLFALCSDLPKSISLFFYFTIFILFMAEFREGHCNVEQLFWRYFRTVLHVKFVVICTHFADGLSLFLKLKNLSICSNQSHFSTSIRWSIIYLISGSLVDQTS